LDFGFWILDFGFVRIQAKRLDDLKFETSSRFIFKSKFIF